MWVIIDFDKGTCKAVRENGDPRFKSTEWANAESTFLYHVKQELIKQGYDVIKKRMWKDGHLMNDNQQYIRTRKIDDNAFYIFNNFYTQYDAGEEFNKRGEYVLSLKETD